MAILASCATGLAVVRMGIYHHFFWHSPVRGVPRNDVIRPQKPKPLTICQGNRRSQD